MSDWQNEMAELATAEEFLDFFGIPYDPAVVRVKRLHILQRFHDYLTEPASGGSVARERHAEALRRAYQDLVHSDAERAHVFKGFRRSGAVAVIPVSSVGRKSR